jgi:flavin-binding protein dodecin
MLNGASPLAVSQAFGDGFWNPRPSNDARSMAARSAERVGAEGAAALEVSIFRLYRGRVGADAAGVERLSTREEMMADSVYKVIELVGISTESWEKAASAAVERAAETLRDLRVAEVVEQDLTVKDAKVEFYRVKLNLSFKYEAAD